MPRTEITYKFRVHSPYGDSRYSFTQPTPNRQYVKILSILAEHDFLTIGEIYSQLGYVHVVNDFDNYWRSNGIIRSLRLAGYVKLYRNGRRFEYKITTDGRDLLNQAYA